MVQNCLRAGRLLDMTNYMEMHGATFLQGPWQQLIQMEFGNVGISGSLATRVYVISHNRYF